MNPIETLSAYLRDAYSDLVPAELRDRYAAMLAARAVRFYIHGQLDTPTIVEDMLEDSEIESGVAGVRTGYPNLEHGEKLEREFEDRIRADAGCACGLHWGHTGKHADLTRSNLSVDEKMS